ncbi:metal ABC transporter ATP-binding protein [Lactococcus ileimucosae]|uniref:Metal ABC transporter ATP-binding protein n=1 Tax=Lactococcus ileimucosae TaxID=2941329 RepID=A0ABV4CZQ0_9LACT
MPYIDVQNVSFYYDNNPVLEDVSYSVKAGEFVTLTGENGAAKSTLIKITLGILKPKSGKVIIARHDKQNRRLRIAYVPQQISSFNAGFPSTVHEFVRSGRYPRKGWFRKLNAHDEEHVEAALKAVEMWKFRHKKIGELSGGQKQRIIIARTFASDPDVFVLDEPTVGMDDVTTDAFYELMAHAAHEHGKSVLMVTHDPDAVKKYMDRNIHLARDKNGKFECFEVHGNPNAKSVKGGAS